MEKMNRNCAICGSSRKENLYSQHLVIPSANFVHAGYDVVICQECGFAFADNLPDQSAFDRYYKRNYKSAYELSRRLSASISANDFEIKSDVAHHRHSVETIIRYLGKEDRILDIGCGTGHLLSLVKAKGFERVSGLDPSAVACQTAQQRYGIDVAQGSLFDELDLGRFDFIILSHVLEHIADLRNFISQLHKLLSNEGRVYIEVPDAHQFMLSVDPQAKLGWEYSRDLFSQFTPEHVNFFSTISLQNLMTRLGFEMLFLESQISIMGIVASVWKPKRIVPDHSIGECLERYIEAAKMALDSPSTVIEKFVTTRQEILVWGAGLHTQRLLGCTSLRNANIRAFVDSNPRYRGERLLDKPILAPDALAEFPHLPVLISSKRSQNEIEKQIHASGYDNPLVFLYPQEKD